MRSQAGQDETAGRVGEAEARLAAGDLHAGFERLKAVLAEDRDHPGALAAMGLFLAAHGDPGQATEVLSRALGGAETPQARARVAPALARLLAGLAPSRWHPVLDADLTALLGESSVDPQILARTTARVLLLKTPRFEEAAEALEALGGDALWIAFLSRCLNVDAAMEARLDALRRALTATQGRGEAGWRTLAQALALNGYLAEHLDDGPEGVEDSAPLSPLFRSPRADDVMMTWQGPLTDLLVRKTVEEPAREMGLAQAVARLTPDAGDDVSQAVRAQYEGNPYPRWAAPPQPPRRVLSQEIETLPRLDQAAFARRARTVLAAGCGTGFEPIDLARTDPSLAITALDLSRASLAYGARVAEQLGLDRVRFVQGDILALEPDMGPFDVVVSTGVLHHMARPQDGLARLAGVLRSGGVVRLALYSERARAPIRRAHALIRERGWTASAADIRAFRAHVLALPNDDPLAALRTSDDFYSLSGCRDLVFHVQEHRYTPPQLVQLLAQAGLRMVGFEPPPPAQAAFRQAFGAADPLDMELWDRLEAAQPTLFAGMYHVWGQKT
jgi:SAM-dependent methyltransferase